MELVRDKHGRLTGVVREIAGGRERLYTPQGEAVTGLTLTFDSCHRFSGLRVFTVLHRVMGRAGHLFEPTINLAQFPEDQNKNNHDYEQQEWDVHLFIFSSGK